jgi:hypothetical protein
MVSTGHDQIPNGDLEEPEEEVVKKRILYIRRTIESNFNLSTHTDGNTIKR